MYAPVLEIHAGKLKNNAKLLKEQCSNWQIDPVFVTKGVCAYPGVIQAVQAGGINRFADSRMQNIIAAKREIPGLNYLLIRIPALDEAEEVVRWTDCSLQSQIETIRAVSEEALRQGKVHPIILMIDVGDLREGVWGYGQISEIAAQIRECHGVKLIGLGTNVGCYGSVLPSPENTRVLVDWRDFLNSAYGFQIMTISVGGTCSLKLLEDGTMPTEVNHIRVGEAILCGEDTTGNHRLSGFYWDAFRISAQVVELKRKPSVPVGELGRDCSGNQPSYPDRGIRLRAICARGKQDIDGAALTPFLSGAEIIGASSDHLIVDVEDCKEDIHPGDQLWFRCGYMAVLHAMTSSYVKVKVIS